MIDFDELLVGDLFSWQDNTREDWRGLSLVLEIDKVEIDGAVFLLNVGTGEQAPIPFQRASRSAVNYWNTFGELLIISRLPAASSGIFASEDDT